MNFPNLPLDAVDSILSHSATPRDLASLALTCKHLARCVREAEEAWEACTRRWARWEPGKAERRAAAGGWRAVVAARHQADVQLLKELDAMVFPLKRHAALQRTFELGTDVLILCLCGSHRSNLTGCALLQERLTQECDAGGPLSQGRRHFARLALERDTCLRACARLRAHTAQPDGGANRLEFGSLMLARPLAHPVSVHSRLYSIASVHSFDWTSTPTLSSKQKLRLSIELEAQVHCPRAELAGPLTAFFDALGQELGRRLAARGAAPASLAALDALSQLLFAEPPPDAEPDPSTAAFPGARRREWRWTPASLAYLTVPRAPYGLGLKGEQQNYYDDANSLLPHVLAFRRGNPITLSVIHAAVGRRAGMPVETYSVPTHFMNHVGEPHGSNERFIDVFGQGQLLSRAQAVELLRRMSLQLPASAAPPREVYLRQCANMIHHQYRQGGFTLFSQLRPLLEVLLAANPASPDYLAMHAQVVEELEDFEAVRADLEALAAMPEARRFRRGCGTCHFTFWAEAQAAGGPATPLGRLALAEEQHRAAHTRQMRRAGTDVRFCVGQIVRHLKYEYRGVVYGWNPTCEAQPEWIRQMNVDALPSGRAQPFFHVLVDNRDRPLQSTYVAQDNLSPIEGPRGSRGSAHREASRAFNPARALRAALGSTSSGGGGGGEGSGLGASGEGAGESSSVGSTATSANAADYAVQHPSVGEYFLGLEQGATRYRLNDYLKFRYPEDDED